MQFSKLKESRNVLQRSNRIPSILQPVNPVSLKEVPATWALLRSQSSKLHSEKLMLFSLTSEKLQFRKWQFSNSRQVKF